MMSTSQNALCLRSSTTQFNELHLLPNEVLRRSNSASMCCSSSLAAQQAANNIFGGEDDDEQLWFTDDQLAVRTFPRFEEIRRVGKLCDVTLIVSDRQFSAHRVVLAATIPYFQAMFTHDMVESNQREISMQVGFNFVNCK